MRMCEEEIVKGERDAVAHHLPLRTLSTIKQKSLAFSNDGERTDPSFDGRSGGRGSEETNA